MYGKIWRIITQIKLIKVCKLSTLTQNSACTILTIHKD